MYQFLLNWQGVLPIEIGVFICICIGLPLQFAMWKFEEEHARVLRELRVRSVWLCLEINKYPKRQALAQIIYNFNWRD
jgi:hypothetical protein